MAKVPERALRALCSDPLLCRDLRCGTVYQALLTRRYLTSKIMPLLAAVAVMLCSAMVLITWSIMGGFLVKFLEVGRTMEGDVSISWPTAGFGRYEDLMERLNRDPSVAAAAPSIDSIGMIGLPDGRLQAVKVRGIDERYARVADFANSLWWRPIAEPLPKDKDRDDPRLKNPRLYQQTLEDGLRLKRKNPDTGALEPGVVLGIELSGFSKRQEGGWYEPMVGIVERISTGGNQPYRRLDPFILNHSVIINVLPLTAGGREIRVASRKLPVVNEFRTGLFDADKGTVLMELGELQRMLKLDQGTELADVPVNPFEIAEDGSGQRPKVVGTAAARVTHIFVKAKEGVEVGELRQRCEEIYAEFAAAHGNDVPSPDALARAKSIGTWEQNYAMFIGAVKKEIAMVLGLLMFISFVAVFLVLAIFWAMVSEKTKDIGVLRAVGASRAGVAWLWLRYGVTLGMVGTLLGLGFSYAIVLNINPIHEWMGRAFGLVVWDPRVYYFAELPNKVVTYKAMIVLAGGMIFSVLGALIPALRAATYDPVKSLRFE